MCAAEVCGASRRPSVRPSPSEFAPKAGSLSSYLYPKRSCIRKMSEYWISPPHFGTLGAKNTTVVHTPRNIDLPAHVVLPEPDNGNHKQQKKRKYLCLSFWLMGLALLTTGAIIVAMFLVPETELASRNSQDSYLQTATCLDLLPLEDKVKNSDLVLVGSMNPDMSLKVDRIIKGDQGPLSIEVSAAGKSCFEATSSPQVFFLSPERQGRSVKASNIWLPKYRALAATEKVVDIIVNLVENAAIVSPLPTLQIEVSTEGKKLVHFLCVHLNSWVVVLVLLLTGSGLISGRGQI